MSGTWLCHVCGGDTTYYGMCGHCYQAATTRQTKRAKAPAGPVTAGALIGLTLSTVSRSAGESARLRADTVEQNPAAASHLNKATVALIEAARHLTLAGAELSK